MAVSACLASRLSAIGVFVVLLIVLALTRPALPQTGLAAHDFSLPIEIAADQLTVEQASRQAVFSGNVEAVQGDVTLRADRLIVHYDLDRSGATRQAIRRIEAEGQVVIASPQESARADRGVYDVAAGTILLEGSVVLSRGEDVVRGGRLAIDLRQQTAVMTALESERVRALFQPSGGKPAAGGR
jgi:lipopolysaccharide export system protein LptA